MNLEYRNLSKMEFDILPAIVNNLLRERELRIIRQRVEGEKIFVKRMKIFSVQVE